MEASVGRYNAAAAALMKAVGAAPLQNKNDERATYRLQF